MVPYLQKMSKSIPSLLLCTPEPTYSGSVFGIDEAGRGCLAGPVVAACVAFDWLNPQAIKALDTEVMIRDSKLMTRRQRQESAEAIKKAAVAWGIGVIDAATIDEVNILQATFRAMRKAVGDAEERGMRELRDDRGRKTRNAINDVFASVGMRFLIDGNKKVPEVAWEQEAIVDGDAKVFSIAAASILAKEHRDSLMEAFHAQDPRYGFEKHKGYGTKAHYAAIAEYGVTPLHRKTFLKKITGID